MAKAHAADAVIFGAVGGPKWDAVPYDVRPEAGLLRLRKDLGLFANIRPAICYPALAGRLSLKREVVDGLDIIILRELTGGVYFGEPKTITDLGNGQKRAVDTQVYDTYEIERISRSPSSSAQAPQQGDLDGEAQRHEDRRALERGGQPVACARVQGRQARASARRCRRHAAGALAQAVRRHRHRQPVRRHALRRGGHADRLARHAAVGVARRGRSKTRKRKAMYEPVHGSAPDIAGKGVANPIAMLASFGMALRYSLRSRRRRPTSSTRRSPRRSAKGLRTADIKSRAAPSSPRRMDADHRRDGDARPLSRLRVFLARQSVRLPASAMVARSTWWIGGCRGRRPRCPGEDLAVMIRSRRDMLGCAAAALLAIGPFAVAGAPARRPMTTRRARSA